MSNLETINGKTYQRVPIELNGVIVKFVLWEVPATPSAPVVADSAPAEIVPEAVPEPAAQEEAPFKPAIQEAPVEPEVQPIEELPEPAEDASDSESILGLQSDVEEKSVEDAKLVASPIAAQKTIEEDESPVFGDDECDTRSESSTGSSTLDQSVDMDDLEEFPGLKGEVASKTAERDIPHTSTAKLNAYWFAEDLEVVEPANLTGFYLIAVDGHYVFSQDDLNRFNAGEHNLLFRKAPNSVKRSDRRAVCYRPTYKSLQKIQVRTGPGSKYEACGVIPANEEMFVIQEGLLSCELPLVVDWMTLHLPQQMLRKNILNELMRSRAQTFDEFIEKKLLLNSSILEDWRGSRNFNEAAFLKAYDAGKVQTYARRAFPQDYEEFLKDFRVASYKGHAISRFAEMTFGDNAQSREFIKAAKAANRKVKVMWTENGVEKCGWISKRKNNKSSGGKKTKPLITRVMGATAAPQVQVFNVSADIPALLQRLDCTFSKDAYHFKETAKRKVPSRYFNGEDDIVHCYPPLSFYHKLAKTEIAKIIGSKHFNISWEGEFKLDRYRGLEKEQVVCDDGKTRYKTGYYVPNNSITITFQRYSDANAFLNFDFEKTRFSGAFAEASGTYAKLHAVPADLCPEFARFETEFELSNGELTDEDALERGIHYVSV